MSLEEEVSACKTIRDLELVLAGYPNRIKGSWTTYSGYEQHRYLLRLVHEHNHLQPSERTYNHVTRSYGIRKKVMELLECNQDVIDYWCKPA